MKQKRSIFTVIILSLFMVCAYSAALAGVSAEEAAKLKTTLTPTGAERAGNADGTIPAWEGGITEIPAGFKKAYPHVDPFTDDKVQFSITAANMDKYADKLSEGQKALLKKFPDTYKLNIYQTRRSHSGPQWYYDNTFKNATNAKITEDGGGVTNAFAGIAFPIPKTGEEVMWSFLTRWKGTYLTYPFDNVIVPAKGDPFVSSSSDVNEKFPYYDIEMGYEKYNAQETPMYLTLINQYTGPPRKKGEIILAHDPLNQSKNPRLAWQYLPGQRRVRRAPTVSYDTPNPGTQSILTYDDVFMFNGALDRYNWKLIGKKEMYIPYNCYKAAQKYPLKEGYTPNHPNADYWRWELHRVWVVEATLKQGKRHIYAKRTLYFDEDSWTMAMRDVYDAQGSLWRTSYAALKNAYDLPGVVQMPNIYHDLYLPEYVVNFSMNLYEKSIDYENKPSDKWWSPENVRRLGRR